MARQGGPVAYLKLFRFPLVFTAIADSAAGYVIANPSVVQPLPMMLLALSSAGLYFFGMALNDIADRNRDKLIAPDRMLPSGRLTLKSAKIAAYVALGCSLAAILAVPETPILQRVAAWALVVLCIAAYNLFFKIPPVMGLVRGFNLLLGVAAGRRIEFNAAGLTLQYAMLALPGFIYVTSLTYVSTLEDAAPSRRKLTVGVAVMCVGALLAALAGPARQIVFYFWPPAETVGDALKSPSAFLFSFVLIGAIVRRTLDARNARDKESVKESVKLLVRDGVIGIIFLDSALLASCEDGISGLLIATLVFPAALSIAVFRRLS
jgi:4-hydroxybenzoate polyprenyltransferase